MNKYSASLETAATFPDVVLSAHRQDNGKPNSPRTDLREIVLTFFLRYKLQ